MTEKAWGIIFDPSGYNRLVGMKIFKDRSDAEFYLKALICDYPDIYNFEDYKVMEIEVSQ